ncbi:hypothetical protein KAR91_26070 [Candidatus Pacearchaeota archaeon]|nr:hypothetical protein [Candidatus Pacearchaeota archaeon]
MKRLLYKIRHYMCYTLHWHNWKEAEDFKGRAMVSCKYCTNMRFIDEL